MQGISHTQISSGVSAKAGSLVGNVALFASQGNLKTLDLSTEGVLDWFNTVNQTSGAIGGSFSCKGGTSLSGILRDGFRINSNGGVFGPQGSSGLTSNSDQVDSSGHALLATSSFEGVGVGNNPTWLNWGFEIQAPASQQTVRNLNLYFGVLNGTNGNAVNLGIIGKLSDDSAPESDLVVNQIDSNQIVVNIYKANFQFKCATPGAKLRVQVFVTGITGSMQFVTLGLQSATLF